MGNENSTQEFLNSIHKNPELSLMHITAVKEKCVFVLSKDKVICKIVIILSILYRINLFLLLLIN